MRDGLRRLLRDRAERREQRELKKGSTAEAERRLARQRREYQEVRERIAELEGIVAEGLGESETEDEEEEEELLSEPEQVFRGRRGRRDDDEGPAAGASGITA
jgi:hypothetical protein